MPNTHLDERAVNVRLYPWLAYLYNAEGYLFWGANMYPEQTLQDVHWSGTGRLHRIRDINLETTGSSIPTGRFTRLHAHRAVP